MRFASASLLRWGAFSLVIFPAILRAVTVISPDLYFASDPRLMPMPADGLGPAGSMLLDLASLLGLCLALLAEFLDRRRLDLILILLFAAALPAIAIHAGSDIGQVRAGSSFVAAIATAVAAAHLGRDPRFRILTIAAVMALVSPLVIKGLYQITVEHQMTIEDYRAAAPALLAAHGWEPDSASARLYERRLMQNEATGWFSLSNVYGSVLAGLAMFWIAAALAAARSRLASGWTGLVAIIALAAMAGVALSQSKGAILAAIIGLALVALSLLPRRRRLLIQPFTAHITFALIALALIATILRGALLGDRFTADGYSLLFRWHYWQGAARMIAAHPIIGVGPDGFKDAYLILKPPVSPEEVTDPHSVFIAFLSMLGVIAGAAWTILTLLMVRRAAPSSAPLPIRKRAGGGLDTQHGTEASQEEGEERQRRVLIPHKHATLPPSRWHHWIPALATGLVFFLAGLWLNHDSMLPDFQYLFWPAACLGYAGLMGWLPSIGRATGWVFLRWGAWAALSVILLHSQIEMTLTHTGAAAAIFALLGALSANTSTTTALSQSSSASLKQSGPLEAGAQRREAPVMHSNHPPRRYFLDAAVIAASFFILITIATLAVTPTIIAQSHLSRAAASLSDVGPMRTGLASASSEASTSTNLPQTLSNLRRFSDKLASLGFRPAIDGPMREIQAAIDEQNAPRLYAAKLSVFAELDRAVNNLELARIDAATAELLAADNARLIIPGAASHPLYSIPNDPQPLRQQARLAVVLARFRADTGDSPGRITLLKTAANLSDELIRRQPNRAASWVLAAAAHAELADTPDGAAALDLAIQLQQHAAQLDPFGIPVALRLAQWLDRAGRIADARACYQKTLDLDAALSLDPEKRLSDSARNGILRRLDELKQ